LFLSVFGPGAASDWLEWRGPARDGGVAGERPAFHVVTCGTKSGWKVPYGVRSAPMRSWTIEFTLQNTAGKGELEQERVMCFNGTGKTPMGASFQYLLE